MARTSAVLAWLEGIWPEARVGGRSRRWPALAFEHLEQRRLLAVDGMLFALEFPAVPGGEVAGEVGALPGDPTGGAGSRPGWEAPEVLYLDELARSVGEAVDLGRAGDGDGGGPEAAAGGGSWGDVDLWDPRELDGWSG